MSANLANGDYIQTYDGYMVTSLSTQLSVDGDYMCQTNGNYIYKDGEKGNGTFQWQTGDWQNSIKCTQSVNNKCKLVN